METRKVDIEIMLPEKTRDAWWNGCVGEKFEAEVKDINFFTLTERGLKKLAKKLGVDEMYAATVHADYACVFGENIQRDETTKFEIIKNQLFLTEVRRFRVTKSLPIYDRGGDNITGYFVKEGDIFEEIFDKPNTLICVSDETRMQYDLSYINESTFYVSAFEEIEPVSVKDSEYYETQKKRIQTSYKRTVTNIARQNEKLNYLRFLLDIEDEDDTDT